MSDPTAIVLIKLLIVLSGTCALFAVAGVAARMIETYERMKAQRQFRAERVVSIKTRVRA